MKREKIFSWLLFAAGLVVVGAAIFLLLTNLNIAATLRGQERGSAAYQHKPSLETFQTVTVEASFKWDGLENVLGYDENTLSDIFLKNISSRMEGKFGKEVSVSRYGKPYSFETNPLNVAVTFNVIRYAYDKSKFDIEVTLQRSYFFTLLRAAPYSAHGKEKYDELIKSGAPDASLPVYETHIDIHRIGHSTEFSTKDELLKRIDKLADVIVDDMNPNADAATEAEESLKRSHRQ